MKITKQRLKEIIKEEFEATVSESERIVSPNQDALVELQDLANQLGAGDDFVDRIRDAIAAATATQTSAQALELMIDALRMLQPQQPDTEDPVVDDAEALVLPDEGRAGYERSLRNMARRGNE